MHIHAQNVSFVQCFFKQLVQTFVAKNIRNSINNIVEVKQAIILMKNNGGNSIIFLLVFLSFPLFLFLSFFISSFCFSSSKFILINILINWLSTNKYQTLLSYGSSWPTDMDKSLEGF